MLGLQENENTLTPMTLDSPTSDAGMQADDEF